MIQSICIMAVLVGAALGAPLADYSNSGLFSVIRNGTHPIQVRDVDDCPNLWDEPIKVSLPSTNRLAGTLRRKKTLKLDRFNLEGENCVYTVPKGFAGQEAIAVTPLAQKDEAANGDLIRYSHLMEKLGVLLAGPEQINERAWAIVARSGKHIRDTQGFKVFFDKYDASDPDEAEFYACEAFINGILDAVTERAAYYAYTFGMVNKALDFQSILFSDDLWDVAFGQARQQVIFINWPTDSVDQWPVGQGVDWTWKKKFRAEISQRDLRMRGGFWKNEAGDLSRAVEGVCLHGQVFTQESDSETEAEEPLFGEEGYLSLLEVSSED